MTRPLPIAASLVLAALSFAAFAQTEAETGTAPTATSEPAPAPASEPTPAADAPVVPPGSAVRGKHLTFTCQGCHGVVGYKKASKQYQVPLIVGQSATFLSQALQAYQKGTRKTKRRTVQYG